MTIGQTVPLNPLSGNPPNQIKSHASPAPRVRCQAPQQVSGTGRRDAWTTVGGTGNGGWHRQR